MDATLPLVTTETVYLYMVTPGINCQYKAFLSSAKDALYWRNYVLQCVSELCPRKPGLESSKLLKSKVWLKSDWLTCMSKLKHQYFQELQSWFLLYFLHTDSVAGIGWHLSFENLILRLSLATLPVWGIVTVRYCHCEVLSLWGIVTDSWLCVYIWQSDRCTDGHMTD